MAQVKRQRGIRNDYRKNGKAVKKNPGPDGVKVKDTPSQSGRVDGRSAAGHAKREAWKAMGGRADHPNIPHWRTGKTTKSTVIVEVIEEAS